MWFFFRFRFFFDNMPERAKTQKIGPGTGAVP